MSELKRRQVLQVGALTGLAASLNAAVEAEQDDKPKTDREFVIAAGMTEAEADCWAAIAKAAGLFFQLPQLHPMDEQEVASAIHIIQNKLLSRPTYRKYLELAKANSKN